MNRFNPKPGDKVTYIKKYAIDHGIVKEMVDDSRAFVVYNCNKDWKNYKDYTGQSTNLVDLREGWMEKEVVTGGIKWTLIQVNEGPEAFELWSSQWACVDGDIVDLLIDEGGAEFSPFSGIPASKISIDPVDIPYISNKITIDFKEPLRNQYMKIANYFCFQFCKQIDK